MGKYQEYKFLYLIGNGFDIHHDIKSGYGHFKEWLKLNNYVLYNRLFQCYDLLGNDLWEDLEVNLANISAKAIIESYHSASLIMQIRDSTDTVRRELCIDSGSNISSEIYTFRDLYSNLQMAFENWVEALPPANPSKKVILEKDNSLFINFNYTNTLECYYGISPKRVIHIHGKANCSDNLIFGHNRGENELLESWNYLDYDEESQQSLIEAAIDLQKFRKDVDAIIEANNNLWSSLLKIIEIHIWGLSLSSVDMPYLRLLKSITPKSVHWQFSWYSQDDYDKVLSFVKGIGIENYSLIKLDDIIQTSPIQASLFDRITTY